MEALVVDDHSLVLQGMERMLERVAEIKKVHTATCGAECCAMIESCCFDLYVLDIELPDMSGFELIEKIRRHHPQARIIINTMHEQVWVINKLLKYNVDGVILKSSESSVVEAAAREVLQGRSYCCPRFSHISLLLKKCNRSQFEKDVPTRREMDVLRAIAGGHNSAQIAQILGISENTVETHRKQLFLKLNAKNAIELIVKAVAKGLIAIDPRIA